MDYFFLSFPGQLLWARSSRLIPYAEGVGRGGGQTWPMPASQYPSPNFVEFFDCALQQFQSCNGLAAASRESNANDMRVP
jgi:hypothetical protein